jgi:diguanylate cyclase (GGDEF)-like protein
MPNSAIAILALLRENLRLRRQLATDALTGAGSRHAYQTRVVDSWQSYIIVDVDKFRAINDTHGHPVGDAILAAIGKLIRDESDHVFRTGGDEFAVVLNASFEAANVIADRIKTAIGSKPILGIACSVSVGVGTTATAADAAMYHQKINATPPLPRPPHDPIH